VSVARQGTWLDRGLYRVMYLYDDHSTERIVLEELQGTSKTQKAPWSSSSLFTHFGVSVVVGTKTVRMVPGEEFLASLRFEQDVALRGAQLLLDQCPHLRAHRVAVRHAGMPSLCRRCLGRSRSAVAPARLTMEDLFERRKI
jgi:hypothetical protein